MEITARDLLVPRFDTVRPDAPITEAIGLMDSPRKGIRDRRIFGLMVVDEKGELAGTISMFDVLFHFDTLYHMEPVPGAAGSGEGDWEHRFELACESAGQWKVGDIMTRAVVRVDEHTGITDIIDIMTKTHIRRLPVCRGRHILGVIYISDVFYEIYKHLLA